VRKKLIIFIGLILAASAAYAEGDTYVFPGAAATVELSSTDINRLICPVDIQDVIFSQEKGIKVRYAGKNAFIKFLITKKGDELAYATIPSELFVVCGEDVYNIIALPKRIPSQTVRLSSGMSEKIKKNRALFEGLPFERKVLGLIKGLYVNDIPDSFTVKDIGKKYDLFQDLSLSLVRVIVIEGEGLQVKEYAARINADIESKDLREMDFLIPELASGALAVSVSPQHLTQGDTARIFIVERMGEGE
jgi:conjugal transfer pilus assembly protein TraK